MAVSAGLASGRSSPRSFGAVGAYAATQSGICNLEVVVSWGALTAAMLRYATPLMFAALGGLVSRARRRREHRAGGHDAHGRVLRRLRRRQDRLVGRRASSSACWPGWRWRAIHAIFAISLRSDQIVVGTGAELPRARPHRLHVRRHLRRPRARPTTCRRVPDVNLPTDALGVPRPGDQPAQPAGLGLAGGGRGRLGRGLPHAGWACGCAPSARTRRRPRRSASASSSSATRRSSPRAA